MNSNTPLEPVILKSIAAPTGPISESTRLKAIDAARGIALLGIFFVNAAFFSRPFGELFEPHAPTEEGLLGLAVFWFTAIFCQGKFYPLFSILFGAGLAMMYLSSQKAGRKFGWLFFRRLVLLGLFGILHIVLLWYGDILLIYALVGLWMLLLGRCSPKTLLITAGIVFLVGILILIGLIGLMAQAEATRPAEIAVREMPEGATSVNQFVSVLKDWNPKEMFDSRLMVLEREIMSEGPFGAAVFVRLFNYVFSSMFIVLVMFWSVLPCFCLGAALLKLGFLHGENRYWRKRFIVTGLVVGLPLNVLAAVGTTMEGSFMWKATGAVSLQIGGPLMSLMYLSLILNWVDTGRASVVSSALANLGRMALTGYLLESILMSAVMMHWGLAKFGTTTWGERAGWVIVIFLAIVAFANLWMRYFRFGPFEWLWRSLTYWRWQPLRR